MKQLKLMVCGSTTGRFRMLEMVKMGHFENKKGKLKKELAS